VSDTVLEIPHYPALAEAMFERREITVAKLRDMDKDELIKLYLVAIKANHTLSGRVTRLRREAMMTKPEASVAQQNHELEQVQERYQVALAAAHIICQRYQYVWADHAEECGCCFCVTSRIVAEDWEPIPLKPNDLAKLARSSHNRKHRRR